MASNECQDVGKSSWPELLGANGKDAAATIESENPNVSADIALEGSFVLPVILCDKVRVWVDTNGIVTRVPTIG